MTGELVFVVLPGVGVLGLSPADLSAALRRGAELGLPQGAEAKSAAATPEPLLTSAQLAELTQIGDTTVEAWARQGTIPCIRAGKALRFRYSEVLAALSRGADGHAVNRAATHVQTTDKPRVFRTHNRKAPPLRTGGDGPI